ncbi:diguanylate cyclase [Shewanella sp. 10N.261.52.F9]|uniref:sensor domain-containing diguanylate cyclase n=1 Tax=Shewanella TaxID=22 RepID=UPI002010ADEF|nr:sensor domain-containing diguanylate cyclase [Shewanella marinintestina]MCL1145480.1 sensor domain-containing diguanylate cyclase [Shewanella marinintestina]
MENKTVFATDSFLLDNPNDLISVDKWQKTVNLLAKIFNAPAGFLVQYTTAGFQVTLASQQVSNPYPAGVIIEPEVNIFCRKIVDTGKPLYVGNAPLDPCWDTNPEVHNDGFRSYLGVPVFWPCGTPFGTFCVMDYQATNYEATYLELITQLKDLLESDLALLGSYVQLQQLAITDPLCEVYNRRGFDVLAQQRIEFATRTSSLLGMLYLDVDQFKHINDQYGHGIGDAVLKTVAKVLTDHTREADVIGRLGGDEFVALIAIEDEQALLLVKQELSAAFSVQREALSLPDFSVSIGATIVDSNIDITNLLDRADQDMLKRKQRLAG